MFLMLRDKNVIKCYIEKSDYYIKMYCHREYLSCDNLRWIT